MAMLRRKLLALLVVAAVGLATPTIALARGGGGSCHGDRKAGGLHSGGFAGGFDQGGFGGDHRFRLGWGYGSRPYDYYDDDYNYYDYLYAYHDSYVDNGSRYVVQPRAHRAQLARRLVQVCG
jgi:hypothetical protein